MPSGQRRRSRRPAGPARGIGAAGRCSSAHRSGSATPAAISRSPPSCGGIIPTWPSTGSPSTRSPACSKMPESMSTRPAAGWPASRPTSSQKAASTALAYLLPVSVSGTIAAASQVMPRAALAPGGGVLGRPRRGRVRDPCQPGRRVRRHTCSPGPGPQGGASDPGPFHAHVSGSSRGLYRCPAHAAGRTAPTCTPGSRRMTVKCRWPASPRPC